MSDDPEVTADDALDAWRRYCRRLEALGERVFADDCPSAPEDRADALEHLAGQMLCWTGWSVFHADPRRPRFQRQNDPITAWGGPNAENVYRHARVDASRRYRVTGHMHSCEDFMLTVRLGFMHEPRWGTVFQVAGSDLGIGRGDAFELLVGGDDPGTGRWIPLPEGAAMVTEGGMPAGFSGSPSTGKTRASFASSAVMSGVPATGARIALSRGRAWVSCFSRITEPHNRSNFFHPALYAKCFNRCFIEAWLSAPRPIELHR